MSFPKYPATKNSGVAWLGEVPGHWEVKRLRNVATLNPSKSEIAQLPRDIEVSFLPMEAVGDDGTLNLDRTRPISEVESGYTYFREGDVTVAKITPCFENGKGAVMRGLHNGHGFGTTELIVVRSCEDKTTSDYLHLLFTSHPFRLFGEASMYGAGGQKRVPDDFVRDFAVAFPPPEEQTAIATFLDRETAKIDALVAEQQKLIALLQEKRQTVISHAVTKGLDPSVPMKDSGVEWLGEVPGHWDCIRLKQLVVESVAGPYGASLTKAMYAADGYRVYGQQQVIADDFSVGDYFISEEKYQEMRRYTVFEGDVLVSVMGTIGKVAVVPLDAPPGIINPRLVRYRCGDLIQPRYLQSVLMCQKHQEHLVLESNGTTMDGLNMVTLGRVPIPTPPIDEQTQILQYLKLQAQEFDPLISEARTTITLLQERRTALISAAVTGQIDVRGLVSASQ